MNTKRKLSFWSSIAALVAAFAFVGDASAKAGSVVHITWSVKVDGDATCFPPDDPNPQMCTGVFTADVRSNLSTSVGTGTASFVITAVNGSLDPCNRFADTTVFAFPEGSITVQSDHIDCPAWIRPFPAGDGPGPRIDTVFKIIGGTDAFKGATGGGSELGYGGGRQGAIVYNGTIFLP